MQGQPQPLETGLSPAARQEVLEIVGRLGEVVQRLRAQPVLVSSEIEPLYDIMMRLRWLALVRTPGNRPDAARARERESVNPEAPTVYVVDDNPSIRRALSRLFRSLGHKVETFPSATHFLEAVPMAGPACVVLDVRMPRMSGLDLQQELAKVAPDLPIVFITGHGDIDMAVQAMKDGAVDFLPKPFDDQDLIDSVERALEYHRNRVRDREQIEELEKRRALLSPRENEVFERVVKGMLNKQIGFELGNAEKTVKVHRARVMKKMEAESLADLVRMAQRLGIEGPDVLEEN